MVQKNLRAAEYAVSIANLNNAELIAVNVLTPDIGYVYSSPGVESPPCFPVCHDLMKRTDNNLFSLSTHPSKYII
jgi:hypothetical protein